MLTIIQRKEDKFTSKVFNQDCLIPDEMSSASQNSITHMNSAHTQTGSHVNTILLLSEHLTYQWKEKRTACLYQVHNFYFHNCIHLKLLL